LRKQLVLQAFVVVTSLEQSTKQHVFVVGAGVGVGGIAPVVSAVTEVGSNFFLFASFAETVEAINDAGGESCGACSGVWKSAEESPQRKPRLRARAHKVPNAVVAGISLSAAQVLQPHSGQAIW
jgi:hypothetical protein